MPDAECGLGGFVAVLGIPVVCRFVWKNSGHEGGQSSFGVDTTHNGVIQARYAVSLRANCEKQTTEHQILE